jgi:hypothetical protein
MRDGDTLQAVLWLAVEGESGAWEALWELNGKWPDQAATNRQRVQESIRELARRGWIVLFTRRGLDGPRESLDARAAEEFLTSESTWEPPEPADVGLYFEATNEREKVSVELRVEV